MDPSITTVASGTSTPLNHTYPQWDVDILEECYDNVDMLSLHYYHNVPEGDMLRQEKLHLAEKGGSPTKLMESFLSKI